jgi:hypothetical protein
LAGLELFANQAQTTVSSGGTTAPSAGTSQTWTVAASTGFPAASSTASPPTFFRVTDPAASSEKMIVTNVSGTTWTVTRGAEGTTPVTHTSGFTVENVITAAALEELVQAGTTGLVLPSGDTSGATDTSAINAVAQAGQLASLATGALYYVTNLLPDSLGGIEGNGATLQVATGTTGYAIALKTPATTKQVKLRNFVLNCDNICGGIGLDNTGFAPEVQWVPYDQMHTLTGIVVLAANGNAYNFDNQVRSMRMTDCIQYNCSGYGLYCGDGAASDGVGATDNHFTNFISGHSGLDAMHFEAASGNNILNGCKGFYAGYSEASGAWTSTTAVGLYSAASYQRVIGCSFQQCALHGVTLSSASYTTIVGGECDTNSSGTDVTTGCGVNLTGTCTNITVADVTGANNSYDPPGSQSYGVQLDGTMTNVLVIGNSVTGVNEGVNETVNYVNGGGVVIIDYTQAAVGSPLYLTGNPGAAVQGQTAFPAASPYFAQLVGYDPAGLGYGNLGSVTGAGLGGLLQQAQPAAVSPVTVGDTNAIGSLGSVSVPAHDPVAGAKYRVTAHGTLTTEATPGVITVDLRWGGTTGTLVVSLVTGTSAPASPASLAAVPVKIEGEIEFYTTTTAVGWLQLTYRPTATTASVVWFNQASSAVTVTTSSAENLSLDWTWATANTSNTVTIASSSFERVS